MHVGSFLINTILKKIPIEFHALCNKYIGPETYLQETLDRNYIVVNQLEKAAEDHDIWYGDHPIFSDCNIGY